MSGCPDSMIPGPGGKGCINAPSKGNVMRTGGRTRKFNTGGHTDSQPKPMRRGGKPKVKRRGRKFHQGGMSNTWPYGPNASDMHHGPYGNNTGGNPPHGPNQPQPQPLPTRPKRLRPRPGTSPRPPHNIIGTKPSGGCMCRANNPNYQSYGDDACATTGYNCRQHTTPMDCDMHDTMGCGWRGDPGSNWGPQRGRKGGRPKPQRKLKKGGRVKPQRKLKKGGRVKPQRKLKKGGRVKTPIRRKGRRR